MNGALDFGFGIFDFGFLSFGGVRAHAIPMNPLNPDPATVLIFIRWMVFIATVLTWAAFIMLLRCRACDTGGRVIVLMWLGHAGLWLGVNSTLRLVFGYSAPTAVMSMWGSVLWIQAALSVIIYVMQWTHSARPR